MVFDSASQNVLADWPNQVLSVSGSNLDARQFVMWLDPIDEVVGPSVASGLCAYEPGQIALLSPNAFLNATASRLAPVAQLPVAEGNYTLCVWLEPFVPAFPVPGVVSVLGEVLCHVDFFVACFLLAIVDHDRLTCSPICDCASLERRTRLVSWTERGGCDSVLSTVYWEPVRESGVAVSTSASISCIWFANFRHYDLFFIHVFLPV